MGRYANYLDLERLLLTDPAASSYLERRYPDDMKKWSVLRRRMGATCPLARGVLKVLCAYERDNERLIRAVEEGKWIE